MNLFGEMELKWLNSNIFGVYNYLNIRRSTFESVISWSHIVRAKWRLRWRYFHFYVHEKITLGIHGLQNI